MQYLIDTQDANFKFLPALLRGCGVSVGDFLGFVANVLHISHMNASNVSGGFVVLELYDITSILEMTGTDDIYNCWLGRRVHSIATPGYTKPRHTIHHSRCELQHCQHEHKRHRKIYKSLVN